MYAPNLGELLRDGQDDLPLGIYKPAPVSLEPNLPISRWSVRQVPDSKEACGYTHHVVGFNEYSYDGRVSSKIVTFDRKAGICITKSGRRYSLVGEPGIHMDAEHVWYTWLSINKISKEDFKDVSDQYVQKIRSFTRK